MAAFLYTRGLVSDAQSAGDTFTSWDKCMAKTYCKYVLNNTSVLYQSNGAQVACYCRDRGRLTDPPLCPLLRRPLYMLRSRVMFVLRQLPHLLRVL